MHGNMKSRDKDRYGKTCRVIRLTIVTHVKSVTYNNFPEDDG